MTERERTAPMAARFGPYLRIARPDHWVKNVFMLPGAAIAWVIAGSPPMQGGVSIAAGLLALCFASSANYTINEFLDRNTDRHHPSKKQRAGALGLLDARLVALQYAVLAGAAAGVAAAVNREILLAIAALLVMGLLYNVPPIRLKDRTYLDVLSEAINNPIRFLIGWHAVSTDWLPPSSILIAYWMGGAFLMAMKRYAEYRTIDSKSDASLYRRSFRFYDDHSLLASAFFYAISSSFFLAIFLIKYRIEFLLAFPLFSFLFTAYLRIALRHGSAAQAPEALYRERGLLAFVALLVAALILLSLVDIPWLHRLTEPLGFQAAGAPPP